MLCSVLDNSGECPTFFGLIHHFFRSFCGVLCSALFVYTAAFFFLYIQVSGHIKIFEHLRTHSLLVSTYQLVYIWCVGQLLEASTQGR